MIWNERETQANLCLKRRKKEKKKESWSRTIWDHRQEGVRIESISDKKRFQMTSISTVTASKQHRQDRTTDQIDWPRFQTKQNISTAEKAAYQYVRIWASHWTGVKAISVAPSKTRPVWCFINFNQLSDGSGELTPSVPTTIGLSFPVLKSEFFSSLKSLIRARRSRTWRLSLSTKWVKRRIRKTKGKYIPTGSDWRRTATTKLWASTEPCSSFYTRRRGANIERTTNEKIPSRRKRLIFIIRLVKMKLFLVGDNVNHWTSWLITVSGTYQSLPGLARPDIDHYQTIDHWN